MNKTNLLLIVILTLSLFSISSASASLDHHTACVDANLVIPVNLNVVGVDCHKSNKTLDSTIISLPQSGVYAIKGIVERGRANQTQTNEAFFLEILGQQGPTAEDDLDENAITSRLDFLGNFTLQEGEVNITMKTSSICPPDIDANSVDLTHLCFYLQEEEISCSQNSDCGASGYIDSPFCSEKNATQNYKTYTCSSPGTNQSFCSSAVEPKTIESCSEMCSLGQCTPSPLFLNITSPTEKTYDNKKITINLESNGNITFSLNNGKNNETYLGVLTKTLSEGKHTLIVFAVKGSESINKSVDFKIDLDKDDDDRRSGGSRISTRLQPYQYNSTLEVAPQIELPIINAQSPVKESRFSPWIIILIVLLAILIILIIALSAR